MKQASKNSMKNRPDPKSSKPDAQEDSKSGVKKETPEIGGPKGLEPTRYGDWERKGILSDF